jgi:hypothetical protein
MTCFGQHVDDYLRLRRSLGYKLHDHAHLLRRFAVHLDAIGAELVTVELALAWALEPEVLAGSVVPAMRLLVVRGFARYMAGIDPRTEIPPTGLIRFRQQRRPPFIYTDAEILALMAQARTGIRQTLCAATYETLIGLLAATGMRISEAIKLDRTDIDWAEAGSARRELLRLAAASAARHGRCPGHVPTSVPERRRRRGRSVSAEVARPQAHEGREHAAGLVSRRCRRPVAAPGPRHLFGASRPVLHLRLPLSSAGASRLCRWPARHRPGGAVMTLIAPTLQAFFSDRLVKQLHASPRTIASYRDTLSLLLRFLQDTTGTAPSALDWDVLMLEFKPALSLVVVGE